MDKVKKELAFQLKMGVYEIEKIQKKEWRIMNEK